ncbi:MAG: phosphatidylserine/phosphatidylglycerophosphate/cardiolipin synthase family protein [Candidatus Riflebacteria bacterium]|nr:phosphatidylserine/phosphatidylglycerophosphate/cardiolipin synthase family protein [Candidatus Riflebacteria bacterium]
MRQFSGYLFLIVMMFALIGPTQTACADVEKCFDGIQTNSFDPDAKLRFLPDNVNSWFARWQILDNAKESIDVTYFIVEQDIFGMSMLGMLYKKAKQGVRIRLMVDARGTKGLTRKFIGQDVLQEMMKFKNVQIRVFNPVHRKLLALFDDLRKITASNHDKIILVDNEYLITGGRNISKNYFVDPKDLKTVYRDTDILVQSRKVANQAGLAFDEEFRSGGNFNIYKDVFGNNDSMSKELELAYNAMRRYITGGGLFKVPSPTIGKRANELLKKYNDELEEYKRMQHFASFRLFNGERSYPTRILDKHSITGSRNDITANLSALMDAAESEIIIQNPYVVLTEEAKAAIKRASDRGVRIIIHTNSPMSSDSLLTQAMFIGDWKGILKEMPNVRIFGYKLSTKLHSKVFVFDRKVAVIGTYNMDYVSEQINSEVIAVVKAKSFATQVAQKIMEDMKNSHEYKIKVESDGSVKTLFGPESHSDKSVIGKLNMLQKLQWLKPLI